MNKEERIGSLHFLFFIRKLHGKYQTQGKKIGKFFFCVDALSLMHYTILECFGVIVLM